MDRRSTQEIASSILDAAATVFVNRGYEATTMQEVAAKCGMTAPALYYYFDSKQRLLFEAIERSMARYQARLKAVLAGVPDSPVARLAALVRTHVGFQLEQADGARVFNAMFLGTGALFAALTPRQRTAILALQVEIRDQLKAILERGLARGEFAFANLTVTAMGILAMGEFAVSWFQPGSQLTVAEVADQYAEIAIRMVAPVASTSPRAIRATR
jgi:AcrR family transcriptional regulator